ncbi:MAG: hypothetical protein JO091_07180 [Acidobacteriaceae bacterium]|nr:hypothetical protein [Acidobacteriaceae bacterium]
MHLPSRLLQGVDWPQNNSFSPNWIWREVLDVEVMTPAVGAGVEDAELKTTVFGVPKFA